MAVHQVARPHVPFSHPLAPLDRADGGGGLHCLFVFVVVAAASFFILFLAAIIGTLLKCWGTLLSGAWECVSPASLAVGSWHVAEASPTVPVPRGGRGLRTEHGP